MPNHFDIDLANKQFVVVGLRGHGKTVFAKSVLESVPESHIVYDPNDEYHGYRSYVPDDPNSPDEMDAFIRDFGARYKPDLLLFDEINTYVRKNPTPLPTWLRQLVNNGRHWGVSAGYIARRPASIHTDIIEIADWLFIFNLAGKNDFQHLETLSKGLGEAAKELDDYAFLVVDARRRYWHHQPLDITRFRV